MPQPARALPRPQALGRLTLAAAVAGTLCAVLLTLPGPARAQDGAAPRLQTSVEVRGLRSPWDIAFAPDGAMLFTEKCHGLSVRLPGGEVRRLMGNAAEFPLRADDLFCRGQSGVHGVAVDPQFAAGQRFVYVFSASELRTNPRSNRVIRLRVAPGWAGVSERTDIVDDIAFKEWPHLGGPGAHSGGRIRFGPDGFLWITTGDNHDATLPQDPQRLGGKVLRVDRDGRAAPGNNAPAGFDARVYTYGHRNVQGIAFRPAGQPGAGQAFAAEHGPQHGDEVTPLVAGGNGGWDPQNRPGLRCPGDYCGYGGNAQTMPMTDTARFPNAMPPAWINNARSEGMGPAEFLDGPQWGAWNGRLAVSLMRGLRLDILALDARGMVTGAQRADIPDWRLRSLVQGPDGALWGSTDDGTVVRIAAQR